MKKPLKILIINPPIRLTDKPRHIPHGLAILANVIRKRLGAKPVFIDMNAHRYDNNDLSSMLRPIDFDIVLVGGLVPVYKRIVTYADIIKKVNPKAVIIAGGSAAMSVPELLLRHSNVDIVCAGEGEKAIMNLLKGLTDHTPDELTEIKGFYFKTKNGIVFSGKPDLLKSLDMESELPAYDMLPMEIYLANPIVGLGRDVDFISSRGCPYNCSFCYQPWGRSFRAHSPAFVIDALKYLRERYHVDFISFQDDEFLADRKRAYSICDGIRKELPGLLWSCTGRANLVDDELVSSMRGAGCVSISYGFESGSPRMLESMNKRTSIEDMEKAIRINRRYGMMVPVSFILGMPGEDERSCSETVEFCIRNKIPLKSIMYATPYPGTQIFDYALSTGRIKQNDVHNFVMSLEDARDFTVNLTDAFSDKALIAKREAMINEVSLHVKAELAENYMKKLKSLFGTLADDYFVDETLLEHRAQHGGIDIF